MVSWLDTWLDVLIPKQDVAKVQGVVDSKQDNLPTQANWMPVALDEVGVSEIVGAEDNPRILEYHQATSLKASNDETPWCAAYVNWVLSQVNIEGTDRANARSFTHWGLPLEEPKYGCIVVLKRGDNKFNGHVGFYVNSLPNGRIQLLGGNQGNKVSVAAFKKSDVIAYRWPFTT